MRKSIFALATAAALATSLGAQADTILYGSARVSIDYLDEELADGNWDVIDNDSRLGVQGVEDLGGGLSAVYQYEFGVDVAEGSNFTGNRPKFVGLKGNFGSLTVGTQETPYYHIAGVVDVFNSGKSFGSAAFLGGSFNGFQLNKDTNSRDLGDGGLFRLDNSLYYATPDLNGFSGEVMLVMNGKQNDAQGYSNGIDLWNVAAKYSNGPFFAGASYIKLEGKNNVPLSGDFTIDLDLDQWNVGLGYASGPFSLGLMYEQGMLNEFGVLNTARVAGQRLFNNEDAYNWYLAGEYKFGNNTIRAAYGQLNTKISLPDEGSDDTIDNYLVGYQYDFSRRTRIWVEYIGRRGDSLLYGDADAISIGTRVDF